MWKPLTILKLVYEEHGGTDYLKVFRQMSPTSLSDVLAILALALDSRWRSHNSPEPFNRSTLTDLLNEWGRLIHSGFNI